MPNCQWHDVKMANYFAQVVHIKSLCSVRLTLKAQFPEHHPQHQRSHELSQVPWSSCSCTQVWQRSTGHCQCLWILQQWTQNFWQDPKRPTDKQQECSPRVPLLKMNLQGHSRINFKTTCGLIMQDYKVFPEFAKLASVGLCMPITSVPAECGYSLLSSEANSHDHFPLAHTVNISNGMRQHWK